MTTDTDWQTRATLAETQRDTLLLGLQAILQAERISDLGATTVWEAVKVCLDAGLVDEDFAKRLVGRINAALELARTSEVLP